MQLGKYSLPIAFQSMGAEQTSLKNYISTVSMNAEFRFADTLSKNLSAELYFKSAAGIFDYTCFAVLDKAEFPRKE